MQILDAGEYTVEVTFELKDELKANYSGVNVTNFVAGATKYKITPKTITEDELKAMLIVNPDGSNGNNIFEYNKGTTHTGAVTIKTGINGLGIIEVEHYNENTKIDAPENVGTYDIKVNITGATNYVFGDVNSANINGVKVGEIVINPVAYNLDLTGVDYDSLSFEYDAQSHRPVLTGLTDQNVTVSYKYKDKDGNEIAEGTEIKNAGNYTVEAKFELTDEAKKNYSAVNPESELTNFKITPKTITETELKAMLEVTPDGTNNNNIFNYKAGETHTGAVVIKNGIEGLGTVTVEHYNGETKVDAPENVGTYDIKVNVTGATNYAFGTDKNANISGVKVRRNKNKSNSI